MFAFQIDITIFILFYFWSEFKMIQTGNHWVELEEAPKDEQEDLVEERLDTPNVTKKVEKAIINLLVDNRVSINSEIHLCNGQKIILDQNGIRTIEYNIIKLF